MDVRPEPELWAFDSELRRWNELQNEAVNVSLSNTEISELVLAEDWPSKLAQIHKDKIRSMGALD